MKYKILIELYREDGITGVLGGLSRAIRREVPFLSSPPYQASSIDIEDRWGMIRTSLNDDDHTLLDIGCNAGEFTSRAAKEGYFSVGIDIDRTELIHSNFDFEPGLALMNYEVTPENVSELPTFDVVLLLSVFHQWGGLYGWENAEEMLAELANHTDKLFLEFPLERTQLEELSYTPDSEPDDTEEYYRSYLKTLFDRAATVEYLDTISRSARGRTETGEKRIVLAVLFD